MKIVFVSNFLNHHQIPFCEEIRTKVDDFYFIATDNGSNEGYQRSENRDYVIDFNKDAILSEKEIISADAVIFGSCPYELIELRMKENKLSFIYSERFLKKGVWRCIIPKIYKTIKHRYINHKNKNLYVLAASAFLPYDLSFFGFPQNKIFKWGYFPECQVCKKTEKQQNTILYAGRLLDWKHTETVIEIANFLKKDGYDFKVNIIGDGPQKDSLVAMKDAYGLDDCVEFLGSKTHEEVLEFMQKSSIFMFTSDFYEGWGAVLNEAMANGCAIVASCAPGSVPFLISHGENGMIYKYGNTKNAYNAVKTLLNNPQYTKQLGEKAQDTILYYNYNVAAERFLSAVNEFYNYNKITPVDSGIFSPVEIIKNNWFKSGAEFK